MSKLKDSSVNIGSMPESLPSIPRVRPSTMQTATPRDSGGMSVGVTSGNFNLDGMTSLPNNAGATGTADVAADVAVTFGTLNTSTL